MKVVAIVGLLLCAFFAVRVYVYRHERNATEKILWFITVTCGGYYFLSELFR
jgi:hypothetical protein